MFLDVILSIIKSKNVDDHCSCIEWNIMDFESVTLKWIDFLLSFINFHHTDATKCIHRVYACQFNKVETYKADIHIKVSMMHLTYNYYFCHFCPYS